MRIISDDLVSPVYPFRERSLILGGETCCQIWVWEKLISIEKILIKSLKWWEAIGGRRESEVEKRRRGRRKSNCFIESAVFGRVGGCDELLHSGNE